MSQATTWGVPGAGPATPVQYAERDNDSFDAILSSHSGTARPSYAVAGTRWIDEVSATEHNVYHFDGTDDILICTINPTANSISFSGLIIGTDVQAYDADTAKTDVAQSFTAPQRADMATVTDGTLDLDTAQNFIYTPGAADTLEFSNEAAGQSGIIFLTNGSDYAITLGSEITAPDGTATAISATGEYVLTYAVEAAGGGADTVKLTYATVV